MGNENTPIDITNWEKTGVNRILLKNSYTGHLKNLHLLSDEEISTLEWFIKLSEAWSIDPKNHDLFESITIWNISLVLEYAKNRRYVEHTVDSKSWHISKQQIWEIIHALDQNWEALVYTGSHDDVAFTRISVAKDTFISTTLQVIQQQRRVLYTLDILLDDKTIDAEYTEWLYSGGYRVYGTAQQVQKQCDEIINTHTQDDVSITFTPKRDREIPGRPMCRWEIKIEWPEDLAIQVVSELALVFPEVDKLLEKRYLNNTYD